MIDIRPGILTSSGVVSFSLVLFSLRITVTKYEYANINYLYKQRLINKRSVLHGIFKLVLEYMYAYCNFHEHEIY